jgi:hypothetical protein
LQAHLEGTSEGRGSEGSGDDGAEGTVTYTQWVAGWKAGNAKAREQLLKDADEGRCGAQIRHTLFGLGDLKDMRPDDIKEAVKSMTFYARLE